MTLYSSRTVIANLRVVRAQMNISIVTRQGLRALRIVFRMRVTKIPGVSFLESLYIVAKPHGSHTLLKYKQREDVSLAYWIIPVPVYYCLVWAAGEQPTADGNLQGTQKFHMRERPETVFLNRSDVLNYTGRGRGEFGTADLSGRSARRATCRDMHACEYGRYALSSTWCINFARAPPTSCFLAFG